MTSEPLPIRGEPAWRRRAVPALLITLAVAAFSNAAPREFLFDAKPIIAEHPLLAADVPWQRLFVKTYWGDHRSGGLYRPLTLLTYRIEKHTLGFTEAWAFARANLALHVAVVLLLWRLAWQWTGSGVAALVAAAVFAVHPIATEVVPNLVGRADLLVAIGLLGALLLWRRVLKAESIAARLGWASLGTAAWCVGLLSKESAIVFPAVAGVLTLWHGRANGVAAWPTLQRQAAPLAVLAVVAMAYLAVYSSVTRAGPPQHLSVIDNPAGHVDPMGRVLTAVAVYGQAARVILFPINLSIDYSFDALTVVRGLTDPSYLPGLAALAVTLGATGYAWRRRSPAALGLALLLLAYLPTSNLLFAIGTIFAERLLYVPLLGVCVALGVVGEAAWSASRDRPAARGIAAVTLAVTITLLGTRTFTRNAVWRDHDTLFLDAVERMPTSVRLRSVAATIYAERENTPENLEPACVHAGEAYRIAQGMPEWARATPALNYGATLLDRGLYRKASGKAEQGLADIVRSAALFEEAKRLRDLPGAQRDYVVAMRRWRVERGLPPPEEATSELAIHANLGKAYSELGRWRDAAMALEVALAEQPGDRAIATLFGRALANAGELPRSTDVLLGVARAQPMDESAWNDAVRVLRARGLRDEAAAALDEAAALGLPAEGVERLRGLITP